MPGPLLGTDGFLNFLNMGDETLAPALLQFFMPFLMLAVNIIVQVLGCRYSARLSLLKSAFFGYGIGLVCLLTGESIFYLKQVYAVSDFLALAVTNFVIYSMFSYWYFVFITLAETAIRTRLLMELDRSEDGLSEEEMLAKYNASELIEKRINRLVENGQIINNGGRYYRGKSGLLLFAKFSGMMHRLVPGKKRKA